MNHILTHPTLNKRAMAQSAFVRNIETGSMLKIGTFVSQNMTFSYGGDDKQGPLAFDTSSESKNVPRQE